MTYEKFCLACDRFHKMEQFTNKLYDMGMLADNCQLNDFLLDYAEAICDGYGADAGWFLNWIYDEVLDARGVGEHSGKSIHLEGRDEMFVFLHGEEAKECWI